MLVVISPAKKLDENCNKNVVSRLTIPTYLENSSKIVKSLRKYSVNKLSELMNVSEKISLLNYERYIKWSLPFNKKNSHPALLLFQGDVYKGLKANSFNNQQLDFAQQSLRIISGLYGILKPFDLIYIYLNLDS